MFCDSISAASSSMLNSGPGGRERCALTGTGGRFSNLTAPLPSLDFRLDGKSIAAVQIGLESRAFCPSSRMICVFREVATTSAMTREGNRSVPRNALSFRSGSDHLAVMVSPSGLDYRRFGANNTSRTFQVVDSPGLSFTMPVSIPFHSSPKGSWKLNCCSMAAKVSLFGE